MLGIDDGKADLDRRQLVGADATDENFLCTLPGIEAPAAAGLYQRNRQRPFIIADQERCLCVGFESNPVSIAVCLEKRFAVLRVGDIVTRTDQPAAVGAQ